MATMRSWLAVVALFLASGNASAAPCAGFTDVDDTSPFCGSVTFLRNRAITLGCNPAGTLYCPGDPVSRLAMAAFMNRLADALFPLNCIAGQVMKWNGAAWTCSDDVLGGGGGGGTVTSVLAGTGLLASPNPIVGAGSINIAPAFQLPQNCQNGEVPKSNGTGGWTCAVDASGGVGTVTQVDTGTGLTGGPITSTGTVAIAAGGVGTAQLADGAVANAKLGANAVTTAKIADASLTTAKLADAAVTTPKLADASVTAAKIAPGAVGSSELAGGLASSRPAYVERSVDTFGTGQYLSIVVGIDGLPLIAYYAQATGDLKVAHCETVDCASATLSTLDSAGNVGLYVSAVLQLNGLVAIAYRDETNAALKIAFCANVACTSASLTTIDTTNDVGKYASMTIGNQGRLYVSYFDESNDDLKHARCNAGLGAACNASNTWNVTTPASTGNVGRGTAITSRLDDDRIIAYFDATLPAVRVAICSDDFCTTSVLTTIHPLTAGRVAEGLAITVNHNGYPVVSFIDRVAGGTGNLRIVLCLDPDCTTTTTRAAGTTNFEATSTGLTIPYDNLPIAVGAGSITGTSCDNAGSINAGARIKCLDPQCSAIAQDTINFLGGAAGTINSTDQPIFAIRRCNVSGGASQVGIAHCATASCMRHIRPR